MTIHAGAVVPQYPLLSQEDQGVIAELEPFTVGEEAGNVSVETIVPLLEITGLYCQYIFTTDGVVAEMEL